MDKLYFPEVDVVKGFAIRTVEAFLVDYIR